MGTLGAPLAALPARAEDELRLSPAIQLSVTFGDGFRFGLGLDLRATYIVNRDGCENLDAGGAGFFGQAIWYIGQGARLALGVHGGKVFDNQSTSWDLDLGWTYTLLSGLQNRHGFEAGLILAGYPLEAFANVNVSFPENAKVVTEGQLGLGGRTPAFFGDGGISCAVGRPLRNNGEVCRGPVALALPADPRRTPRRSTESRLLGLSRLEDAQMEAASVPAFLALARDLRAAAAPPSLRRRALIAARDEVHHAALCSTLASRLLGARADALIPPTPPATAAPASTATSPRNARSPYEVTRLALESWRDGCLGEGAAVVRAQAERDASRDPETRATLARIIHDETQHAELGWDLLAWGLATGGRPTRDAFAVDLEQVFATAQDRITEASLPRARALLDHATRPTHT